MGSGSDEYKPGHHADRRAMLYGEKRCSELASDNKILLPWFGYSCWSEEQGSCGTLPYGIVSFSILNGRNQKNRVRNCWVFRESGAAAHGYSSSRAIVGAFVSASVLTWLAL
jgi:hypothetical protein